MLIAALFTTAKLYKQPRNHTTEAWIKKVYIYTMQYYSSHNKEDKIMLFADKGMEVEIIMLS
jgi:hypothetical protein